MSAKPTIATSEQACAAVQQWQSMLPQDSQDDIPVQIANQKEGALLDALATARVLPVEPAPAVLRLLLDDEVIAECANAERDNRWGTRLDAALDALPDAWLAAIRADERIEP